MYSGGGFILFFPSGIPVTVTLTFLLTMSAELSGSVFYSLCGSYVRRWKFLRINNVLVCRLFSKLFLMSNGQTAALGFFHGFAACACFSGHKLNSRHSAGQDEKLFRSSWNFISAKKRQLMWVCGIFFFDCCCQTISRISKQIKHEVEIFTLWTSGHSPKSHMVFVPGNHNSFLLHFPKYQHEWLKSSSSILKTVWRIAMSKMFQWTFLNGKGSIMFMHQHALVCQILINAPLPVLFGLQCKCLCFV